MKKLLSLLMILAVLLLTGCETAATLLVSESEKESQSKAEEVKLPEEVKPESILDDAPEKEKRWGDTELKLNSSLTFVLDARYNITSEERKDRILLATDAKRVDGELQLEESNYWCLAVMADSDGDGKEDKGYNLWYEDEKKGRIAERVDVEINEYNLQGIPTTVITAYVYGKEYRQIYEYLYDGEKFIETKTYDTGDLYGGMTNKVSVFSKYEKKPEK